MKVKTELTVNRNTQKANMNKLSVGVKPDRNIHSINKNIYDIVVELLNIINE